MEYMEFSHPTDSYENLSGNVWPKDERNKLFKNNLKSCLVRTSEYRMERPYRQVVLGVNLLPPLALSISFIGSLTTVRPHNCTWRRKTLVVKTMAKGASLVELHPSPPCIAVWLWESYFTSLFLILKICKV